MSVEHLAAVLHHSKAKGTAKLVLLGIANHQGDGGAWPSIPTLSTYANVDDRNVQRAIAKLVELRELRVDVKGGGSPNRPDWSRPNRYDVLVSCPPWCDKTPNHRDTRKGRQTALLAAVDNPVAKTPPPTSDQPDPVAPASPPLVAPAPPEPNYEPCDNSGSASTTDRARAVRPGCMPGCVIDQENHDGVCRLSTEPPHEAIEQVRERLAAASAKVRDREREVER